MYRELLTKRAFCKRANDEVALTPEQVAAFADAYDPNMVDHMLTLEDVNPSAASQQSKPRTWKDNIDDQIDKIRQNTGDAAIDNFRKNLPPYQVTPLSPEELTGEGQSDKSTRNALLAALGDKNNYGALAALGAAGLGGLGGAAFGGNADDRILNAITGAAGGAGAVGGARGAMELLEGNVDPLLAAGLGGVTGGIGSGALARLLAKTLMK